jgi:hypothetical protein
MQDQQFRAILFSQGNGLVEGRCRRFRVIRSMENLAKVFRHSFVLETPDYAEA